MADKNSNKEKKNLLVFAGAGASVVAGYPTTREFMANLNLDITADPIYHQIPQEEKSDIERVLWFIQDRILKPIEKVTSDPFLHDNLFKKQRIAQIPLATLDFYEQARELQKNINKEVHSQYGVDRIKNKRLVSPSLWINGLIRDKEIRDHWNIEIFTTNYDIIIEKYLDDEGTGHRKIDPFSPYEANSTLETGYYAPISTFSRDLWLTKLHGSLKWKRAENGDIEKLTEDFSDNSAVLYPGFKDEPEETPFKQLHQYFALCLGKCDAFLSIGFSYRDDYINDLIKEKLNKAPVYIIDPRAREIAKKDIWKYYNIVPIEQEYNLEAMKIFKRDIAKHFRQLA